MAVLLAEEWLAGLSEYDLRQLESKGQVRTCQAGALVFIKGKSLTHYYFVAKGLVAVYRQNRNGKRWIASMIGEGTFFPHIGFDQQAAVYPASAEALTACTLLVVAKKEMIRLLQDFPSLQEHLTRFLSVKSQELIARCSDSLLESATHRLVQLLRQLAYSTERRTADGWYLTSEMLTEENMADYIGVRQETVSRIMSRLSRDRIIRRGDHRKIYIDLKRLED